MLLGCSDSNAGGLQSSGVDSTSAIEPAVSEPLIGEPLGRIVSQPEPEPSPFDQLRLSPDETAFVYDTWQLSLRACMAGKGFEFVASKYSDVDVSTAVSPAVTADQVAKYGYEPPPEATKIVHTSNDQQMATNPAFVAAMDGPDGTSGCWADEQARIYGDDDTFVTLDALLIQTKSDLAVEAEQSDVYEALDASWSDCMSQAGFQFSKPGEALAKYVDGSVTSGETTARVADLNCQAAVSYEHSVSTMQNSLATKWLDSNPGVLEQIGPAKKAYLARISGIRAAMPSA